MGAHEVSKQLLSVVVVVAVVVGPVVVGGVVGVLQVVVEEAMFKVYCVFPSSLPP
jgi:hypothetical protein